MQRRFLLITAGAICIAILVILFTQPTSLLTPARRKPLRHPPTRVMSDDEAPLHLCDSPSRIPHKYIVFLHFGHSLEQHKQAVGDGIDFDSAITNIFPETANHGLYYAAELHNASLAAVRADIRVDFVECNIEVGIIEDPVLDHDPNHYTFVDDISVPY